MGKKVGRYENGYENQMGVAILGMHSYVVLA